MPAHNSKAIPPTPASPRNTAKYTNKDGSKFITVPKGTPSDSSQPSTPTTARDLSAGPAAQPAGSSAADAAPAVNRKKQKRRQKAAAKAAAEQAMDDSHPNPASSIFDYPLQTPPDVEAPLTDDEFDNDADLVNPISSPNGDLGSSIKSKKNKKKKKKAPGHFAEPDMFDAAPTNHMHPSDLNHPPPPPPPPPATIARRSSGMSRDKIWSTNNHEERERIKEFWLGLGEEERKSLVKVEKDAVLKKMKEQQKHTCSCTVCGRKRTAIEEELEGLYDAYYLELEQFANQGEGPPLLPPAVNFSMRPRSIPARYSGQPPSRGRIVEHVGDDDDDDDDDLEGVYSEDEVEDDEYSDDEPPEEFQSPHDRDVADFLTFGNSLQVKGGILTVADDLLKNDGKRFIEMMEQLAERRMAREEDAREHFARGYSHPNGSYPGTHTHPPEEDEYEDEEEEEEDYEDSQDEEYDDEEEQMTEEQRMEEGRRMFQIFAARMFEQRVLSAYKEKVAKERQQKLLEELEEESRQVDQQKAKKAKNAQKKKDKAAQKKQALAEEKARRDAEKAAEETARVEAEVKRAAEQKLRAEEKRRQREAQKKAEEDARLKKEADRQRRLHDQREKQAEQERKARELKDREKKLKDEQRLREQEARELREREAQERKDKQERDKRDKEARALKAQREAQEAREAREKAKEDKAAQRAAAAAASQQATPSHASPQPAKRSQQQQAAPVPVPAVVSQQQQQQPTPSSFASPKIPVATPAISKAAPHMRPRNASQQQHDAVPTMQPTPASSLHQQSPQAATPVTDATSPIPSELLPQRRKTSGGGVPTMTTTTLPQQPSQSVSPAGSQSKGQHFQPAPFQMPPVGMQPPPGLVHHPPPGFAQRMPHEPMYPPGFRPGPNVMMPPPGINGPANRGFPPIQMAPPSFTQPGPDQFSPSPSFAMPRDIPPATHTRQGSSGFDGSPVAHPIGRPAPIGRPGSVVHGRNRDDDDEATHLGSRALLDDDDDAPLDLPPSGLRPEPPGLRAPAPFAPNPFMDSGFPMSHNSPWGPSSAGTHTFPPPGFNNAGWGAPSAPPGFAVGSPGALGSFRPAAQPRHVAVRLMLCQACRDLAGSGVSDSKGFIDLGAIRLQIESQSGDSSLSEQDLLNLCDTEGSPSNGGGTFDVLRDASGPGKHAVRWSADMHDGLNPQFKAVGAPGEIGSPLTSRATLRGI